jgi:hypothetical protein
MIGQLSVVSKRHNRHSGFRILYFLSVFVNLVDEIQVAPVIRSVGITRFFKLLRYLSSLVQFAFMKLRFRSTRGRWFVKIRFRCRLLMPPFLFMCSPSGLNARADFFLF